MRNKCYGKGKIDIKTNEFYIINKCYTNIEHKYIT